MSRRAPTGATALVVHARCGLLLARAAESALAGATAALAALWALVRSSGELASAPGLACAALAAVLGAASWWLAHRRAPAEVARALDLAFGLDGALRTAFEVEAGARAPLLGPLLTRRVCARVDARAARRAVLPRSGLLIALPFVAAAGVALARQEARTERAAASLPELTGRLRAELAGLAEPGAGAAPQLSAEELREVFELARRAGDLEAARRRGELEPEAIAAGLEALQRDLEALEADLPPGGELARRLEAVEHTLDAAHLATRAPRPEEIAGAREDGVVGAGASSSGAAGGGGAAGGELTPAVEEGTMSGLEPPPGTAAAPPSAGYAGGRWWPAEEDALVARWIELRRGASSPAPR